MSATIRNMTPSDLAAVMALNEAAFGQSDEGEIVETLHEDGDNLLSLVAVKGDDICGHIQFFPIDLQGPTGGQIAGLGPMSVHPNEQKSGIGGQLIQTGLNQLKQDGVHYVFVLGHPEYYPKFGFSVDATAGFAAPWGGPAFMAIELNPDGPQFGQLHYPAAFQE